MTSPADRAADVIRAQLEVNIHDLARQAAEQLDDKELLGDDEFLRAELNRRTGELVGMHTQLAAIRDRIRQHLDDPEVLASVATVDKPWHDALIRDLLRILDGNEEETP